MTLNKDDTKMLCEYLGFEFWVIKLSFVDQTMKRLRNTNSSK